MKVTKQLVRMVKSAIFAIISMEGVNLVQTMITSAEGVLPMNMLISSMLHSLELSAIVVRILIPTALSVRRGTKISTAYSVLKRMGLSRDGMGKQMVVKLIVRWLENSTQNLNLLVSVALQSTIARTIFVLTTEK